MGFPCALGEGGPGPPGPATRTEMGPPGDPRVLTAALACVSPAGAGTRPVPPSLDRPPQLVFSSNDLSFTALPRAMCDACSPPLSPRGFWDDNSLLYACSGLSPPNTSSCHRPPRPPGRSAPSVRLDFCPLEQLSLCLWPETPRLSVGQFSHWPLYRPRPFFRGLLEPSAGREQGAGVRPARCWDRRVQCPFPAPVQLLCQHRRPFSGGKQRAGSALALGALSPRRGSHLPRQGVGRVGRWGRGGQAGKAPRSRSEEKAGTVPPGHPALTGAPPSPNAQPRPSPRPPRCARNSVLLFRGNEASLPLRSVSYTSGLDLESGFLGAP